MGEIHREKGEWRTLRAEGHAWAKAEKLWTPKAKRLSQCPSRRLLPCLAVPGSQLVHNMLSESDEQCSRACMKEWNQNACYVQRTENNPMQLKLPPTSQNMHIDSREWFTPEWPGPGGLCPYLSPGHGSLQRMRRFVWSRESIFLFAFA